MKFAFIDKKSPQPEKVLAYAEKKVGKLDRYFHDDAEATIRFQEKKRGQVKIEVTVRAGSALFRAESYSDSMFSAIDAAVDTIVGQIRKNKTRLSKRLKKDTFDPTGLEVSGQEEIQEDTLEIVRTKHFSMAPMTVEEAILQMNLLGHTFFAFRNEDENGSFAVVYAREDGGYGLIVDNI